MNQRVEQIFGDRLVHWSERTAVKLRDHEISYRELDRLSNRLARRLIHDGVETGAIVAIAVGDIRSFTIAVLGVLKAGAAYLAIDTRHPVERVREILADARPAVLLIAAELPEKLIPVGLPVVRDYMASSVLESFSDQPVEPRGCADDAAYVCYTSGSTGRPKGIEVSHRGIPGLVSDSEFVPFGPDDRVGQASNFAFDATTFEVWGALLNGGSIVHMPKSVLFAASALADFLESGRISILMLTTSLFNALASSRADAFGALNALIIGGEAADPIPIGKVLRSGRAPRRFINAYGPTETTTFATWHEVTLADVECGHVPIGRALHGVKLHILDERMNSVQAGDIGELFIGGPGVANGYLHDPGLTDERFVASPFASESSERLYRSGDLCRELPDGSIDYIGRIDDQMKIRGFRIEPSDVVATLRRLDGVQDAIVMARNASFGTRELIAFVRGTKDLSVEHLRQQMADRVPDYMVPSIIRSVEEFPLTENGKLDRAALLAIIQSGAACSGESEQSDATERQVAQIWKRILQREDVTLDDDFRALGGDSLSLMNLALEIENAFEITLSVEDLGPPLTVSGLAAQLRGWPGGFNPARALPPDDEHEAPSKVFALSYPWVMARMPEAIEHALSPKGRWQHVQLPITYFRGGDNVTIEDMAEQVQRMICSMSPEGPYVLFGHCFTGLLAYEVARRLQAAGREVSLLVIVDSLPTFPKTWVRRARVLAWRLANFAKRDFKSKLERVRARTPSTDVASFEDCVREACARAASEYRPLPYDGRVIFFRPAQYPFPGSLLERDLTAWRRLVRGSYTEHLIEFHDQGNVTAETALSGYKDIAARLSGMDVNLA